MRGESEKQLGLLSVINLEARVRKDHPLRRIKPWADRALGELSPVFGAMYSGIGRPSIPPERLLKSLLLMAFYSVRSDRLFCERLEYDLLFRWFLDMDVEESGFDASTFSKNRGRLMEHEVASKFFAEVVARSLKPGPARRAFGPRPIRTNRRRIIFTDSNAATTPIIAPPTATPGSCARAWARKRA